MIVDVSTGITIRRPRRDVAGYAARPDNAPSWYVNIESVRWLTTPPLSEGARILFAARFLGRRLEYVYEVVDYIQGERLVMRTAEGPFPMETSYLWHDTPRGDTRMTLRNRGAPGGWAKLGIPLIGVAMRMQNRRDLMRLKTILEQGIRTDEFVRAAQAARAG